MTMNKVALSIVIASFSSDICGVLSINSQVQVPIQADEKKIPTHCLIIMDLRLGLCKPKKQSFKDTKVSVSMFSADISKS